MTDNQELEGIPLDQEVRSSTPYLSEVYNPQNTNWESVKDDVVRIEKSHFGENAYSAEKFKDYFDNPDCTVILLRDPATNTVVGFTYTSPAEQSYDEEFHPERLTELAELDGKSAYVEDTAIDKDYIGKHLVGQMMTALESELVNRGYSYLERDAAVTNDYAANIKKTYEANGRLVYAEPEPHESIYGSQQFFRMRLPEPFKE